MRKIPMCLYVIVILLASQYAFGQNNTYTGSNAGNGANGGQFNSLYGVNSGNFITGDRNSFFGSATGELTTSTFCKDNTFIGFNAGRSTTSGHNNVYVGSGAGNGNTSGERNTIIGASAGVNNANGILNVYLGYAAGYNGTANGNNVFIGSQSGYNVTTGMGNVFLGHRTGYNETASNKLYIDNSDTSTPLIYGDFSTNKVGINALPGTYTLNVGGVINATGVYVNGVALDLGNGTVNPWSTNSTTINYNTGNVGIGVANNIPLYKLHVNGAVNATEFRINGNPLPWAQSGPTLSYMSGSVGIGTTNPLTYKLAVNGTIGSKEVKVENTSLAWPDYVFESNYKLPTLKEVENFVRQNKHLPDVPSQQEIARDGHALGQTDVVLLKKVEELTLYLIEQSKQLEEMRAINQTQSEQLKKLEKTVAYLKSSKQ